MAGEFSLIDLAIIWMQAHPLQCVAVLAGISIVSGLLFVPRVHEIAGHGHPRC